MCKKALLRQSRSTGSAAIVIVVLFVLVLAVVAISQGYFASFVADQSLKSSMGQIALDLARNAQREAHFRLGQLANEPKTKYFQLFRERVNPFSFSIPVAELPAFKDILASYPGFTLEADEVKMEVLLQSPSSQKTPARHDKFGTLKVSCSVFYAPLRVTRRLQQVFDFRVCLTRPPRFFDNNTFLVSDSDFLVNSYALENDANKSIEGALKKLKDLYEQNDKMLSRMKKAMSSSQLPAGARASLEQMVRLLEDVKAKWPQVKLDANNLNTDNAEDTLHLFPRQPLLLYTNADTVDLAQLNLPDMVKVRMEKIQTSFDKLKETLKEVERMGKSASPSQLVPYVQRYHDDVLYLAGEYRGLLLEDYKKFQDSLIEIAGDDYRLFEPYLAQMDKNDLRCKSTVGLYEKDPFEMDDKRTISQKVEDLLNRGPAFSGLLYISNPKETLTIRRTFKGRLVIVVEGDVTIERATVEDKNQDLLTIISFGSMAVEGNVHGTLMTWGSYRSQPGVTIDGSVIFKRVNFVGGNPKEVMCGLVNRNTRMRAGSKVEKGESSVTYLDAMHFSLAPAPSVVTSKRR